MFGRRRWTVFFADGEDIANTRPGKIGNLFSWVESDEFDCEASLLVVLKLVDVDTVSFGINSVLDFAFNLLFLGQSVDSDLAIVWFKIDSSELEDIPLDSNLLMWDHVSLVDVEALDHEVLGLLLVEGVDETSIVALWVQGDLEAFRPLEVSSADLLSLRDFHEADAWVHRVLLDFLLFRKLWVEARVDEKVTVGCPLPVSDALNSDGLLATLIILEQLHRWQLVDGDTFFDFDGTAFVLLFNLSPKSLGEIVAVETPLVGLVVFVALLLEFSDDFDHLEVPNDERNVAHWGVEQHVALTW